jgi:hypothetical protein
MKLYQLTVGNTQKYGVAQNAEEMQQKLGEVDYTFAYLPVQIEEVTVDGYEITVKPLDSNKAPNLDNYDRDQLKTWLEDNGIEYTPQWGEARLREHALAQLK